MTLSDSLRRGPKLRELLVRELEEGAEAIESALQIVRNVLRSLVAQLVVYCGPGVLQ
jgi:hypothetical protein